MLVYRCSIQLINGKLMYEDIHSLEMPNELFNKFGWDKVIRVDMPTEKCVVFFADVRIALEGVWIGINAAKDLFTNPEEYFKNYKFPKEFEV